MKRYAVLLFLIALLCCSCTATYWGDRGRDFIDCWQFQFRVGKAEPNLLFYPVGIPSPGIKPYPFFVPLYGSVRFTKFLQFGSGGFEGKTYGMLGRGMGVWEEKRGEWGLSLLYYSRVKRKFISGNDALAKALETTTSKDDITDAAEQLGDVDALQPKDRGLFNIGAGAHIVTVGFDFGFDPIEFFDFLFGLFTVDFKKDDLATLRASQKDALEEEKESAQR